jgi:hypothetical protein
VLAGAFRRMLALGTFVLLLSVGAFLPLSLVASESGPFQDAAVVTALLCILVLFSGMDCLVRGIQLWRDSRSAQVVRFGGLDAAGEPASLEWLIVSRTIWRRNEGELLPTGSNLGTPWTLLDSYVTSISVRQVERAEFDAERERNRWRRLLLPVGVLLFFAAYYVKWRQPELLNVYFGKLGRAVYDAVTFCLLCWIGATRTLSLSAWWCWQAFQRDKLERIALTVRGSLPRDNYHDAKRPFERETLLYSGVVWRPEGAGSSVASDGAERRG